MNMIDDLTDFDWDEFARLTEINDLSEDEFVEVPVKHRKFYNETRSSKPIDDDTKLKMENAKGLLRWKDCTLPIFPFPETPKEKSFNYKLKRCSMETIYPSIKYVSDGRHSNIIFEQAIPPPDHRLRSQSQPRALPMKKFKLCLSIIDKVSCKNGLNCMFAHGLREVAENVQPCFRRNCYLVVKLKNEIYVNAFNGHTCSGLHVNESIKNYLIRTTKRKQFKETTSL